MKTFILLTFGFLGFAFYQMSGGADFVPASDEVAQTTPETQPSIDERPAPIAVDNTSILQIDTTPDVTRASLDSTNISTAPASVAPAAAPPPAPEQFEVEAAVRQAVIIDSMETPQIILPSLIATTDDGSQPVRVTDGGMDIRRVSGNRVNVRGGPSTEYSVVGKLVRGDEVQIIEDNGDGWVLMQPLDGGEQGWMADFLLTSG